MGEKRENVNICIQSELKTKHESFSFELQSATVYSIFNIYISSCDLSKIHVMYWIFEFSVYRHIKLRVTNEKEKSANLLLYKLIYGAR